MFSLYFYWKITFTKIVIKNYVQILRSSNSLLKIKNSWKGKYWLTGKINSHHSSGGSVIGASIKRTSFSINRLSIHTLWRLTTRTQIFRPRSCAWHSWTQSVSILYIFISVGDVRRILLRSIKAWWWWWRSTRRMEVNINHRLHVLGIHCNKI